jgi:uncharacterized membrane protein YbhN (UPF0104 family)
MYRKWLPLALKFLVSAFLIWFLLTKIDVAAAVTRLSEASLGMVVLAGAVLMVQLGVAVARWWAVLNAMGTPLPFGQVLRFVYMGWFFNQALPSTVGGDAVRIYKAYRAGLTMGSAVNGVMLDRFATVFALVLVVATVQPFFLARIDEMAAPWMVPAVSMFLAAGFAGIAFLIALDYLPEGLRRWRLARGLAVLGSDSRKVFLAPEHASRILAWSITGHLNVTASLFLLAVGLDLEITLLDCLALFPPVILITTLPVSIAGWGVREGSMVAAFALVGVPAEGALVLSILFGIVVVIVSLPGGLVWLLSGDRPSDITRVTAAPEGVSGIDDD